MESSNPKVGLHSQWVGGGVVLNRAFAVAHTMAILSLLYHHAHKLLHSTTTSFPLLLINISMLISDVVLALMWSTAQSFRMRPLRREQHPENLDRVLVKEEHYPGLDIFICTADPYKEPPINVVNTALSVMAYDYPTHKISVYVSDDGGSELTLFAFMEAAKFGKHWLPFCRDNNITQRSPHAFFGSNYLQTSLSQNIKVMYESMKMKVEHVVEIGKVPGEYITSEEERKAFNKWNTGFWRHEHPTVIHVLLETGKDEDIACCSMPNLIYLSRQKTRASPHHFKAGALNALVRVSGSMTNAPVILTLDCDMYSDDPTTIRRALCYLTDDATPRDLAYVQFPQRFHGLNRADIYACEFKWLFQINPRGMDGFAGPPYVGTGCFFRRRALLGSPTTSSPHPEIDCQLLNMDKQHAVSDQSVLDLAHNLAASNYENHTPWGTKIGFRYGSLVEDYHSGYHLHCEGWKSVFCDPERPAFLGDVPISLNDVLTQTKRWVIGLYEVAFSQYSPLTYGVRSMGFFMAHGYAHYALWGIWSIPVTAYSFLPQLSLLNGLTIFPGVSSPWFLVYAFLFLGPYGQDWVEFTLLAGGTTERWWSDQRMWIIRGLSSYLFGTIEFLTKHLGIATHGFNVTSKVVDDEQSKRYDQGVFEFGVASPMFVPLLMAALINLFALLAGCVNIFQQGKNLDRLFVQMFLAGFGVLNSMPIYDAVILRTDGGRMHTRTIVISTILSLFLFAASRFLLKNV